MTRRTHIMTEVTMSQKFKFTLRKSAAVSQTVVQSTLIIQKKAVTSGTLLKNDLRDDSSIYMENILKIKCEHILVMYSEGLLNILHVFLNIDTQKISISRDFFVF